MKILSFDDIKDVNDADTIPVEVPEWGGVVLVRGMTGGERAEFEDDVQHDRSLKHLKVDLIIKCCINEDGTRVFKPTNKSMLLDKSSTAIEKVFNKIFELSGLNKEGEETAEGN